MAETDTPLAANRSAVANSRRARSSAGADRLTVALFSVTAFFVVLAVLASQVPAAKDVSASPVHVLRKIYRTTVIETIAGGTGPSGTSVNQSVSSSGAVAWAPAPTTRTS